MRASERQENSVCFRVLSLLSLLLSALSIAQAEQLVRTYTTADGLPRDFVTRIVRDSREFLWFCTFDGLSRFSGYEFTTYGVERGLPDPRVNDMLETRGGVYWVATNGGGVCRFNPVADPRPATVSGASNWTASRFTVYPVGDEPAASRVGILYEDGAGQLWAGTDGGLFRMDERSGESTFRRVALNQPEPDQITVVRALVEDHEGSTAEED
jgi:ligand-binding sensor domain-containing protein